jgi:hypothetical protein
MTGASTALRSAACPECASDLEPVTELTDVVGFRSIAEAEVEVDCWLEDGGGVGPSPLAQAVALALLPPGTAE